MTKKDYSLQAFASSRVYCAIFGKQHGAFFTIEVNKKQYCITAKHLAKQLDYSSDGRAEISVPRSISLFSIPVKLVGHGEADVDISVLTAEYVMGKPEPLMEPIAPEYGEDAFFFGFPYIQEARTGVAMGIDASIPFVKKGIISYISRNGRFCISEQVTKGFSGGPVIMIGSYGTKESHDVFYHVIGVTTAYRPTDIPVVGDNEESDNESSLIAKANSGIMVAHDIKFALDIIESNPIGFSIKTKAPRKPKSQRKSKPKSKSPRNLGIDL